MALSQAVKRHLPNVYFLAGLMLLLAAIGAHYEIKHKFIGSAVPIAAVTSIILLLLIFFIPDTPDTYYARFSFLLFFGFLDGVCIGPLVEHANKIDPTIVPTAFLLAADIFICFSIIALTAEKEYFLALGGIILTAISWTLILLILFLMTGSQLIYSALTYLCLFLSCICILYDTTVIIKRIDNGVQDDIGHSLILFIDFMDLFRQLIILLARNSNNNNSNAQQGNSAQ